MRSICLAGLVLAIACTSPRNNPLSSGGGGGAAPPAGTGGGGAAPAGGGGSGGTPQIVTDSGGSSGSVEDALGDAPAGQCAAGTGRCAPSGVAVEVCNKAGVWMTHETCTMGCGNGQCIGGCEPGTKRCGVDGKTLETCQQNRAWHADACPLGCDNVGLACKVCQPSPEDCFNGVDDDCDGQIDCADSDCAPKGACIPAADGYTAGVVIDDGASCPAGFTASGQALHENLSGRDDTCSGCTCRPGKTTCRNAVLQFYASESACLSNTAQPIDSKTLTTSGQCTQLRSDAAGGFHFTDIDMNTTCNIAGAATLPAPTWGSSVRFCVKGQTGMGCASGEVCTPIPSAADHPCLMAAGDVTCPSGLSKRVVYTGFADKRRCTCACTASGGSCTDINVSCSGENTCNGGGAYYGAGACGGTPERPFYCRLEGSPKNPTGCDVSYESQGDLTPTGPSTLCCR